MQAYDSAIEDLAEQTGYVITAWGHSVHDICWKVFFQSFMAVYNSL